MITPSNQDNVPTGMAQTNTAKETCMLCRDSRPFGCETCRNEVKQSEQPKVFIGSGEDVPMWSFA